MKKMYLSFAFPLSHLIIKRERDIPVTPGAVTLECCGYSEIPLEGWEVHQGGLGAGSWCFLGVHPLTDFFPETALTFESKRNPFSFCCI